MPYFWAGFTFEGYPMVPSPSTVDAVTRQIVFSSASRLGILAAIKTLVLKHHINVASIDYDAWVRTVDERTRGLLSAGLDEFEDGIRQLLSELGTSHTTFFHETPTRFLPSTRSVPPRSFALNGHDCWVFLDVFKDGVAYVAGIRTGDRLSAVDGVPCEPRRCRVSG
jgi:hypothetical protein